jgi:hypothetical protein
MASSWTTQPSSGGSSTMTMPLDDNPQRQEEEEAGTELRRGPWTVDEDLTLVNYIADHGEGRWNSLARGAGTHPPPTMLRPPAMHDGSSIDS